MICRVAVTKTVRLGRRSSLAARYFLALSGLPGDAARPVHFGQGLQIKRALLQGWPALPAPTGMPASAVTQLGAKP